MDANIIDYEFTIEDEVIAYEEVKKLYEALDKLTTEQREIVERFYIKEESLREIVWDISREYYSVCREKERALKILRNYL